MPWLVLTDEPEDFADLGVCAIRHRATGPMAVDYLRRLPSTGSGAAAYHDKRFALRAALTNFDTAVYLDADSRIPDLPALEFPPGMAVYSEARRNIEEHLSVYGPWRKGIFEELAKHFYGDTEMLHIAKWCPENIIAISKDGRESIFFDAWEEGARFLQSRGVYSGEGGVIGLAAARAGWSVNYDALQPLALAIQHEGGGPKEK